MSESSQVEEEQRLAALHDLNILDTPPERAFDRITALAKVAFQVPISLVSLVDEDRQWFKSRQGLDVPETPREYSICTYAIQNDSALVICDTTLDPRTKTSPLVLDKPNIRFYAGAPLILADGHRIGTLCVIDTQPREFSLHQTTILRQLADMVVDEFKLRMLANKDGLTGARTRRSFLETLKIEALRSRRYDRPLSVLVFDLDHFKRINDLYGHSIGDAVLVRAIELCQWSIRDCDIVGRIGGEEFAVMLPETDLSGACNTAERLCQLFASNEISLEPNPVRFTASFGVAEWNPLDDAVAKALDRADKALYRAKEEGRNQVASDVDPGGPNADKPGAKNDRRKAA